MTRRRVPDVSVVIPCRDEPQERLCVTIASAHRAGCTDVIVVDDGSRKQPPVNGLRTGRYQMPTSFDDDEDYIGITISRLIVQEPQGIAAALNHGFREAKNEWICWLSVGDTMDPEKLQIQKAHLLEHDAEACFHDYRNGITGKDVIAASNWDDRLWYDNQFCGSTMMVHCDLIAKVGGWDESLQYCVDWMFAMDVAAKRGWLYLPMVLGTAAEHPGGHTAKALKPGIHQRMKRVDRRQVCMRARDYRQELHK